VNGSQSSLRANVRSGCFADISICRQNKGGVSLPMGIPARAIGPYHGRLPGSHRSSESEARDHSCLGLRFFFFGAAHLYWCDWRPAGTSCYIYYNNNLSAMKIYSRK